MISLPFLRASFQVSRVKFSSAAKNVKSTFSRCSGSTLWMKVGSSPTASSWPRRLIIIQQAHVLRWKIPVGENFFQFPAFEGGSADDGHAEQATPVASVACELRRDYWIR